jgi:hypothetical protein
MNAAEVFERLAARLIDAIPQSIAALRLAEPVCCLRVYYYDTHAPCAYLLLKPVEEAFRSKLLVEAGRSALFYLWASGEGKGDGPEAILGQAETDPETADLLQRVYQLLSEDEDRFMPPYRMALQRLSYQLNSNDWARICRVTEDFVVVPADGSQHFADELDDITNSIPPARLDLLRSRGLLGPDKQWDRRPGYSYAGDEPSETARTVEEIEERARAMSVPDRINYWIGQLDQMAAGEPCDMTKIEVNAHFPVDHAAEIGNDAVVPLLKLACRWADKPEWDSDDEEAANPTPMAEVILFLLWKVKEMGYADHQVEVLLREFLERSCQANAGRSLWGTLPVHCADCLHELFDRYPETEMAGNNALANRASFLRIPLP